VNLVMLGSAVALHGCDDPPQQLHQQLYSSQEDCTQDWRETSRCTPSPSPSQPGYYYGPRYYWDPQRGRPVVVNPNGTVREVADARVTSASSLLGSTRYVGSIARGGFGSMGRGFGGGE
jgi:uncharacterized protein YgiB involved in biofilm formation